MTGPLDTSQLDWERDGRDWPNRFASRFVQAGRLRWHVQIMGQGPVVLLLHGTGAATHSWRGVLPALSTDFTVMAVDLPGHGFSGTPNAAGLSLPGMARGLGELIGVLGMAPQIVVGHSAGAAIGAQMCLDGVVAPAYLVSLNGALLPLRGMAGELFSPMAKFLARVPIVPRMFTLFAGDQTAVARLIRDTGSSIDAAGLGFYARLVRSPGHVAGVLGMMANWRLDALARDLPGLTPKLVLVAARGDRTVKPGEALRVRAMVPGARVVFVPDLGHLAHEEHPGLVAEILRGLDATVV